MCNKKECGQAKEKLYERFEFRYIRPEEAEQAARIEQVCFPPNEACTEKMMKDRAAAVPELFLVAVDRQNGQLGGFLCGLATDESRFRDEFFYDNTLYRPQGKNVILLGLDVLPEYRGQGLARELMHVYLQRKKNGEERWRSSPAWRIRSQCMKKWDLPIMACPSPPGEAYRGMK